jgi:uncharacterized membrane protein
MSYRLFVIARALHVLSLIIWIGGLATVTTVILPAMHQFDSSEQKAWLFDQVERRFRPQARIAWLIVGMTGLYMLAWLGAWARFVDVHYWWMDLMVALWAVFGLILFVMEPLIVGPRMRAQLTNESTQALTRTQTLHWILLVISLLVIGFVIAGIYGVV